METDSKRAKGNPRGKASKEAKTSNKDLSQAEERTLNASNYYESMKQLIANSRHDRRLTPGTQLMYRVLADLCNANYWATTFEVTNAELKEIMHMQSNDDITRIKRNLKNLGYIDFNGKPSKYTIYRPPVKKAVQKAVQRGTPKPPYKTYKQEDGGKKKEKKEERGVRNGVEADWLNDEELSELL